MYTSSLLLLSWHNRPDLLFHQQGTLIAYRWLQLSLHFEVQLLRVLWLLTQFGIKKRKIVPKASNFFFLFWKSIFRWSDIVCGRNISKNSFLRIHFKIVCHYVTTKWHQCVLKINDLFFILFSFPGCLLHRQATLLPKIICLWYAKGKMYFRS